MSDKSTQPMVIDLTSEDPAPQPAQQPVRALSTTDCRDRLGVYYNDPNAPACIHHPTGILKYIWHKAYDHIEANTGGRSEVSAVILGMKHDPTYERLAKFVTKYLNHHRATWVNLNPESPRAADPKTRLRREIIKFAANFHPEGQQWHMNEDSRYVYIAIDILIIQCHYFWKHPRKDAKRDPPPRPIYDLNVLTPAPDPQPISSTSQAQASTDSTRTQPEQPQLTRQSTHPPAQHSELSGTHITQSSFIPQPAVTNPFTNRRLLADTTYPARSSPFQPSSSTVRTRYPSLRPSQPSHHNLESPLSRQQPQQHQQPQPHRATIDPVPRQQSPPEAQTLTVQNRIADLESENATLRSDNAALGITIAELMGVRRDSRNAVMNLANNTRLSRDVLLRLLGNDEFAEGPNQGQEQRD